LTTPKFYSTYKSVFDAVKTLLETKNTIKTVVLGEQFSVGDMPKAIINAADSPIKQGTVGNRLDVFVGFDVILIILEYEPKDWFTDVISVMGDVLDGILSNRTLGGTVLDVVPTDFSPGEIKLGESDHDRLLYGGSLSFVARMFYNY
jgi:hypothetical protein